MNLIILLIIHYQSCALQLAKSLLNFLIAALEGLRYIYTREHVNHIDIEFG